MSLTDLIFRLKKTQKQKKCCGPAKDISCPFNFGLAHLQSHIKVVPFALLHPHAQLSFTLFPLECMKRSWQLLLLRCSDGSTLLSFLFFSLRVLHISSLWGCEGSAVTATLPFPSLVLRQDQQPLFEDAWGRVQLLKEATRLMWERWPCGCST